MDHTAEPPGEGICVVVGATGAVGSAVVRRLTAAGRRVLAVARDGEALAALADSLAGSLTGSLSASPSPENRVTTGIADVADDASMEVLAAAVDEPVALVFFAVGLPVTGSLEVIDPSALARATNIKVGGMARVLRALDDRLVTGSRVVAVAGSLGLEPGPRDAAPGTVNAGLLNLMRQASQLLGPRGVVTTTLMLGPLDTPRLHAFAERRAQETGQAPEEVLQAYRDHTSSGHLPTPDEVAWLVETLLAPEARLLHGSAIQADGGVRRTIF